MSVVKHCGKEGTISLPGRNISVVKHCGKEGTTSLPGRNISVVNIVVRRALLLCYVGICQ